MDIGTIPEIARHFVTAVSCVYTQIPELLGHIENEEVQDVWAGLFAPGALTLGHRLFDGLKFCAGLAAIGASFAAESPGGIISGMIADGEVIMDLAQAGAAWRQNHPAP